MAPERRDVALVSESQTPALDRLVDEVVRGDRAISFAPGAWSLALVLFCTLIGTLFTLLLFFRSSLTLGLCSVLASAAITVTLACMVANGLAVRAFERVLLALFIVSVGGAIAAALTDGSLVPCAIGPVTLALALMIMRTTTFALVVAYRKRLRSKLNEQRAASHWLAFWR